jgi:hypothetical protein
MRALPVPAIQQLKELNQLGSIFVREVERSALDAHGDSVPKPLRVFRLREPRCAGLNSNSLGFSARCGINGRASRWCSASCRCGCLLYSEPRNGSRRRLPGIRDSNITALAHVFCFWLHKQTLGDFKKFVVTQKTVFWRIGGR